MTRDRDVRSPTQKSRSCSRASSANLLLALLLLPCAAAAHSGLRIELAPRALQPDDPAAEGEARPTTGWILGRRLALIADSTDAADAGRDDARRLLFDGEDPKLLAVDEQAGTYSELTAGTLELVATGYHRRIASLAEQLERQVASLPEEQRAHADRELRARIDRLAAFAEPAPPAPLEIEPAGRGRFGGRDCTWQRVRRQDTLLRELCTVAPRSLGIEPDEIQAARDVGSFSERLLAHLPTEVTTGMSGVFVGWQLTEGVPIAVRWFEHGEAIRLTEVRVENADSVDAELLTVPEGLQRVGMLGIDR